MNKPLTHADIGRLWDEVGGPKLTSEQWSAMHRFCPRLLKEAAPPPQAAPKAERDPFIRERAQLEQEWSELRAMKAALSAPAERGVPLTDEQRRLLCERVVGSDPVSLVTAERIVIDTERAHGIKDPAAKGGE